MMQAKKIVETINKKTNTLKFICFTFQNVRLKYCFVCSFLLVIFHRKITEVVWGLQKQLRNVDSTIKCQSNHGGIVLDVSIETYQLLPLFSIILLYLHSQIYSIIIVTLERNSCHLFSFFIFLNRGLFQNIH